MADKTLVVGTAPEQSAFTDTPNDNDPSSAEYLRLQTVGSDGVIRDSGLTTFPVNNELHTVAFSVKGEPLRLCRLQGASKLRQQHRSDFRRSLEQHRSLANRRFRALVR